MKTARDNLKFMEDIARLATGAAGSMGALRQQVKGFVKEGMEQILSRTDLVTRAEFERVEGMAEKARLRQEELERRLSALERKARPSSSGLSKAASPVKKKKK